MHVPTRKNNPGFCERPSARPPFPLAPARLLTHSLARSPKRAPTAAAFPAAFFRRIFRELAERSSSRVAGNRPVIRRTLCKNTEARKTDCNRAGSTGTPRIRCTNNMCQKKKQRRENPMGIGMFDRIIDVTDRIHDGEGRRIREVSTIRRVSWRVCFFPRPLADFPGFFTRRFCDIFLLAGVSPYRASVRGTLTRSLSS